MSSKKYLLKNITPNIKDTLSYIRKYLINNNPVVDYDFTIAEINLAMPYLLRIEQDKLFVCLDKTITQINTAIEEESTTNKVIQDDNEDNQDIHIWVSPVVEELNKELEYLLGIVTSIISDIVDNPIKKDTEEEGFNASSLLN